MDLLARNSHAVFLPCEIGIEIPDLPVNPSCKDILHQQYNDISNDFSPRGGSFAIYPFT